MSEESAMFIKIPFPLLQDKNLTDADKLILGLIAFRSNGTGECRAGVRNLARTCGLHRITTQRAVQRLAVAGYIDIIRPGRGRRQSIKLVAKSYHLFGQKWQQKVTTVVTKSNHKWQQKATTYKKKNNKKKEKELGVPFHEIKDTWNRGIEGTPLPAIRKLSSGRRAKLKARWGERDFRDNWKGIITRFLESGLVKKSIREGRTNWINFDWLIKNDENYVKVLEGKYDHKRRQRPVDPDAWRAGL